MVLVAPRSSEKKTTICVASGWPAANSRRIGAPVAGLRERLRASAPSVPTIPTMSYAHQVQNRREPSQSSCAAGAALSPADPRTYPSALKRIRPAAPSRRSSRSTAEGAALSSAAICAAETARPVSSSSRKAAARVCWPYVIHSGRLRRHLCCRLPLRSFGSVPFAPGAKPDLERLGCREQDDALALRRPAFG